MAIAEMRRSMAAVLAARLLSDLNITALPIDLVHICTQNRWELLPYSQIAEEAGKSVSEVCVLLQSDSGITYDNGDCVYVIAYNDTHSVGRQRFSIAHEIAHIVLKHFSMFGHAVENTSLLKDVMPLQDYYDIEQEADDFARNLVSPPAVMTMRSFVNNKHIAQYFEISKACAFFRAIEADNDILRLRNGGHLAYQENQFRKHVEAHPFGKVAGNKCRSKVCGMYIAGDNKRCPVCGYMTEADLQSRINAANAKRDKAVRALQKSGYVYVGGKRTAFNMMENPMAMDLE